MILNFKEKKYLYMNIINLLTRTTKVEVYLNKKHIYNVAIPNKMIPKGVWSDLESSNITKYIAKHSKKTSKIDYSEDWKRGDCCGVFYIDNSKFPTYGIEFFSEDFIRDN